MGIDTAHKEAFEKMLLNKGQDCYSTGRPNPEHVPTGLQEGIPSPEMYEGPLNREAYRKIQANSPKLQLMFPSAMDRGHPIPALLENSHHPWMQKSLRAEQ